MNANESPNLIVLLPKALSWAPVLCFDIYLHFSFLPHHSKPVVNSVMKMTQLYVPLHLTILIGNIRSFLH